MGFRFLMNIALCVKPLVLNLPNGLDGAFYDKFSALT